MPPFEAGEAGEMRLSFDADKWRAFSIKVKLKTIIKYTLNSNATKTFKLSTLKNSNSLLIRKHSYISIVILKLRLKQVFYIRTCLPSWYINMLTFVLFSQFTDDQL